MSQQQTSEWIPTGNSAGNNGPGNNGTGNNGAGKDTARAAPSRPASVPARPVVEPETVFVDYEVEDQLHQQLIRDFDESVLRGLGREEVREQVERATRSLATYSFPGLVGDAKESAIKHVVNEVTGLGPIEPLLQDSTISEVMVNGPDQISSVPSHSAR